jgi:rfaE bifunctional protein nucleotidyltransferase chain/domain
MNEKIKTFKQVVKITRQLKKEGKRIVFCHGVFDILHKGHVTLLAEAKKLGDILVVGVDCDENARILKGPGRPINDQESRMFVLAHLEPVDFVFLIPSFKGVKDIHSFCDKFYLELRPDIVATCMKGSKYGHFKKMHALACGAKFVDIKNAHYNKKTTKIIKLLGIG